MKLHPEKLGGMDKQSAKLVIQVMADDWSPESTKKFAPIRTIELAFAGCGIFKVKISDVTQTLTGHQDKRSADVRKILDRCSLGKQYAEGEKMMMDYLAEHFGPIVLSPSEKALAEFRLQA